MFSRYAKPGVASDMPVSQSSKRKCWVNVLQITKINLDYSNLLHDAVKDVTALHVYQSMFWPIFMNFLILLSKRKIMQTLPWKHGLLQNYTNRTYTSEEYHTGKAYARKLNMCQRQSQSNAIGKCLLNIYLIYAQWYVNCISMQVTFAYMYM